MAGLPETIPLGDALSTADQVLGQAEACDAQAAEFAASPVFATRAQATGILRKAQFLRRMGTELAGMGATDIGDKFEAFLRDTDSK